MVQGTVKGNDQEPEQKKFDMPSEKEHLLQVVDVFTFEDDIGAKLGLDPNTVSVKLEVVGGEEEGRTMLNRVSLDDSYKGFFATRLFLKAISEPYKGEFKYDSDNWIGKQCFATVSHAESKGKTYANIKEYNFDKMVEQVDTKAVTPPVDNEVEWDENMK